VVYAILWLLSGLIANAFAEEQKVADLIQLFLLIVPLGYGFQGVTILTNSSFNAMHKPMVALVLSLVRLFVFFVPICYFGSVMFGIHGIFWGAVIANIMTAVVAFLWFRKLLDKETLETESSLQKEVQ
jgi:Na+-driven multidrug efflux pump